MPSPEFDPNKPFETETAPTPVFNPSQPFETEAAHSPSTQPQSTWGQELLHRQNTFGRGALNVLALGYGDELRGLAGAALDKLKGQGGSFWEDYRHNRDAARAEEEKTRAAAPEDYARGELAMSLLPGALGAAGKGASLLATLGKTGLGGGLMALGNSSADLTRGQTKQAALDTLAGAGTSMALGGLGHGAGRGLGALAGHAADSARLAQADAAEVANKAAQRALRTSRSALGGETAAALQAYENASKVAANAGGIYTPQQVAAARQRLVDPAFVEVVRNAASNALEAGTERLNGSLATARNVFDSAKAAAQPQAIDAATEAALANPLKTQVLPRLKKYATRMIPLAVGAHIGGVPGAVVGGIVGTALGDPGTSAANMLKNPATRAAAFNALERAASAGSSAAQATAPTSIALSPRVAAMLAALRGQPTPAPGQTQEEATATP